MACGVVDKAEAGVPLLVCLGPTHDSVAFVGIVLPRDQAEGLPREREKLGVIKAVGNHFWECIAEVPIALPVGLMPTDAKVAC